MAIKAGDSIAKANFTSSTFNLTNFNSINEGTLFGVMNGPMVTIIFEKWWSGANQSGWVRIANIPAEYRPRANTRGSFWRRNTNENNWAKTILVQVTTGGELQLYRPNYFDTIIGQISYFVDVGNGTGYTAIGKNGSIAAKNFGYESSSLTFLSGRDGGVGSQRIDACGRVVILYFDRFSYGVSPGDMGNSYSQVATIPAGFRPAISTQGSLSRDYATGVDCIVSTAGAFGLRNLPTSGSICSGQIVYFR